MPPNRLYQLKRSKYSTSMPERQGFEDKTPRRRHLAAAPAAQQQHHPALVIELKSLENLMNRKFALALVVAAAAAGNAFADDITVETSPFVSTLTRAEVQAQLSQRTPATSNPASIQYNPLANFNSTLTREQVVADYIANRDWVAAMTGQDSGSAYLASRPGVTVDTTRLAGEPQNAQ